MESKLLQELVHMHNIHYFYLFTLGIISTYFILATFSYWYIYVFKKKDLGKFKIQKEMPTLQNIRRDISWSLLTIAIWALFTYFIIALATIGATKLYFNNEIHGIFYGIFTTVLFFYLHDTYYYWAHRFMHSNDLVYKYAHETHHTTTNPTPFSIFSFSPIEAIIHGIYFSLICFIIPVPFYAIVGVFFLNSFANILGHSGYEFFSQKMTANAKGFILNSLHHNAHHKYGHKNYSIYFPFWDKAMGTLHTSYEKDSEEFYKHQK